MFENSDVYYGAFDAVRDAADAFITQFTDDELPTDLDGCRKLTESMALYAIDIRAVVQEKLANRLSGKQKITREELRAEAYSDGWEQG